MEDSDILSHIQALVDEEHELQSRTEHPLGEADAERQRQIEVALDQCWDLLRQRRARREYGEDPNDAAVRSANIVENYRQ
jgi:Protein of unknown function (DUF2630)